VIRLGLSLLPHISTTDSPVVDASPNPPPLVEKGKTVQAAGEKRKTCMDHADSSTSQGSVGHDGTDSLVHASINLGLDFSHGRNFAKMSRLNLEGKFILHLDQCIS
jgi:hypothetical protein